MPKPDLHTDIAAFLDELATLSDDSINEGDPALIGSFRDEAASLRRRLKRSASTMYAVELGKLGGQAKSITKRDSNRANAAKPRPGARVYRLTDRGLERRTDGQWVLLEHPYPAAAQAWIRRHRQP